VTDQRKRRPGKGGAVQLGGERLHTTENTADTQADTRQFRVIIGRDLWQRCTVAVDPATCTHPLRSFPNHTAAMVYAEALARLEGWPILDRTGAE